MQIKEKFSKNKKGRKFKSIYKSHKRSYIQGNNKPKEIVICLDDDL